MVEVIGFILVALVALFGSLTQFYPGNVFIVAGVGVWAYVAGGASWWWFGAIAVIILASMVVKWVLPTRYMMREGVSNRTLLIGAIGGIIGFFLIPVVGLFIGFPIGVYLSETVAGRQTAWPKTKIALKGVGATILIEVIATIVSLIMWAIGMFVM